MRLRSHAFDALSAALLGFVAGVAAYVAAFSAGEIPALVVLVLIPPLLVRALLPTARGATALRLSLVAILVAAATLLAGVGSYSS